MTVNHSKIILNSANCVWRVWFVTSLGRAMGVWATPRSP
jgi:hypothetical protein